MIKKVLIILFILGVVAGAGAFLLVRFLDNTDLKPGPEYKLDYVSQVSRYAVTAKYDDQKVVKDIIIIDAKSGVSRAGYVIDDSKIVSYRIEENKPFMVFAFYDKNGKEIKREKFNTEKEIWETSEKNNTLADTRSSMNVLPNGTEYKNGSYRFSVTFPKNWGSISENITLGQKERKIFKIVKLTAENDPERYLEIYLVDIHFKNDPLVVDAPMEYIKANSDFAFYVAGSGDFAGAPGMENQKYAQILNETKEIMKTFKFF